MNKLMIKGVELKPAVILAPMAGITDLAYRLICKEMGCGLVVSEMISAKGLYYKDEKTKELIETLPEEAPAAIQIFGSDEKIMAWAADKLNDTPQALLDINMGCPTPKIVKNGDGCALMKVPQKAGRIIRAVVDASMKPVTVKIRKGWDNSSVNALEMARIAEANGASAITVHGRTRDQFYSGKADWEIIRQVRQTVSIPVIGNGDLFTAENVYRMHKETECHGVMIARGAQGNPWIFRAIKELSTIGAQSAKPEPKEIYTTLKRHLELAVRFKGEAIAVKEMRKHAAWYTKGLPGSAEVRHRINQTATADALIHLLEEYLLTDHTA
jgi:tRNA-dihydrouridine synthase B